MPSISFDHYLLYWTRQVSQLSQQCIENKKTANALFKIKPENAGSSHTMASVDRESVNISIQVCF